MADEGLLLPAEVAEGLDRLSGELWALGFECTSQELFDRFFRAEFPGWCADLDERDLASPRSAEDFMLRFGTDEDYVLVFFRARFAGWALGELRLAQDSVRPEYDFGSLKGAVRGKYVKR